MDILFQEYLSRVLLQFELITNPMLSLLSNNMIKTYLVRVFILQNFQRKSKHLTYCCNFLHIKKNAKTIM